MEPCLRHQRELGLWRAHPDTMILNSEYIPGSFGGKKKKRKQTLPLAWPHLRLSFFWPEAVAVEPGNFVSSAPGGLHSAGGDEDQGSPGWRPPPPTHTPRHSCVSGPELLCAAFWVWESPCVGWCCNHVDFLPSRLLVIHWDTAAGAILFKHKIGFHSFPTPTSLPSAWGALPWSGSRFARPCPQDLAGPSSEKPPLTCPAHVVLLPHTCSSLSHHSPPESKSRENREPV